MNQEKHTLPSLFDLQKVSAESDFVKQVLASLNQNNVDSFKQIFQPNPAPTSKKP